MNSSSDTTLEGVEPSPITHFPIIIIINNSTSNKRPTHHHHHPMEGPSSSSSSSSCMSQMGQDQIFCILQLLPVESILSFSATCRKFSSLASSDSLWELICRRDWGANSVDGLKERRTISWKRLYQQVSQLGSVSCSRLLSKDGIFPGPRASHSLNFVSDCLVLFGGGCEGGRHLDDTWVAYVGGNQYQRVLSWKRVHSGTPSGRFGQTCTIVGNTLILFGGINDNGVRLNDTWVGSLTHEASSEITISWRLLEDVGPIAPPPRGAHAACVTGDHRMLVIHGGIGLYGLRLSDTWLLDLSNGFHSARWHQLANIWPSPPARSGHTLTWIGGTQMVLFSGRGSGYEVLNDLWVFDLGGECPKWTELKYDLFPNVTEMPRPRVGHSASLILGGKILIYGGEDSQRQRKDDLWVLDISTLLKVHALGRKKASSTREIWKKLRVENCSPGYRSFHGACTDKSGRYIYIFGGMVDGALQPGMAYGMRFDGELFLLELVLQL